MWTLLKSNKPRREDLGGSSDSTESGQLDLEDIK